MTGVRSSFTSLLKRPAALIILAIVFAANVLSGIFMISGQKREIASLESAIEEARDTHKFTGQTHEQRIDAEISAFMGRLPDNRGLTSVVRDIISAAKKNGLNVRDGNYAPSTDRKGDISKYTINFPVEGRYSNIKRFIYDVESLRHMLTIEDMAIAGGATEKGVVKLTIRISVFYLI